jgi:hypothetical protein
MQHQVREDVEWNEGKTWEEIEELPDGEVWLLEAPLVAEMSKEKGRGGRRKENRKKEK